jgi:5-methyltetrahydropteroyltriglutamate--homocysteine methyltransferase
VSKRLQTSILGFPRVGDQRELKRAVEAYWKEDLSKEELLKVASEIRVKNWKRQEAANIDIIPSNDFSFYDQVLDMSSIVGNIPERFSWDGGQVDLETYFRVARGSAYTSDTKKAPASEMTKWFDTNYHYIVPEFNDTTSFKLSSMKPIDEYNEAISHGITTRPVILGPVSYLKLGKNYTSSSNNYGLLENLIQVYQELFKKCEEAGIESIQIDEPIYSLDLSDEEKQLLSKTYNVLTASTTLSITLTTYFGDVRDNLDTFLSAPVDTVHIDAVRNGDELETVLNAFPKDKSLSLGVINGRNIWINDYSLSLPKIKQAVAALGEDRVIISTSCSLLHSPISLAPEEKMDPTIKSWLSFAEEKLDEVYELSTLAVEDESHEFYTANQAIIKTRKESATVHRQNVKDRVTNLITSDFNRSESFAERKVKQQALLNLPDYPTTTIGSFPQTKDVRLNRAEYKRGEKTLAQYNDFIKEETKSAIKKQEDIDIDVLVHGEFERNDMVEYFGELLDGFVFSQNGWVQSYGSRCVKPPIIFGDVQRPTAMTVDWTTYAQSLTKRHVKGMLTGPITILQWSFEREDISRKEISYQIGLAVRDEVVDLEKAGINIIQIDEPAIREGLPLRQGDWEDYLDWSVKAFRLSASGVESSTQIHTHMCYSEFNDMMQAIADMDADVISIETSRSNMELLDAFENFDYPNDIGPGVYDIHSPRIPDTSEMEDLMDKATARIPKEQLWVNPDCGLKTRRWEEVMPALKNMVEAAVRLRKKVLTTV